MFRFVVSVLICFHQCLPICEAATKHSVNSMTAEAIVEAINKRFKTSPYRFELRSPSTKGVPEFPQTHWRDLYWRNVDHWAETISQLHSGESDNPVALRARSLRHERDEILFNYLNSESKKFRVIPVRYNGFAAESESAERFLDALIILPKNAKADLTSWNIDIATSELAPDDAHSEKKYNLNLLGGARLVDEKGRGIGEKELSKRLRAMAIRIAQNELLQLVQNSEKFKDVLSQALRESEQKDAGTEQGLDMVRLLFQQSRFVELREELVGEIYANQITSVEGLVQRLLQKVMTIVEDKADSFQVRPPNGQSLPADQRVFQRNDIRFLLDDKTQVYIKLGQKENNRLTETSVQWGPNILVESFEEARKNMIARSYPLNYISISQDQLDIWLIDEDPQIPAANKASVLIRLKTPPAEGWLSDSDIHQIHIFFGDSEMYPGSQIRFLPSYAPVVAAFTGNLARQVVSVLKKIEDSVTSKDFQKFMLDQLIRTHDMTPEEIAFVKKNIKHYRYREVLFAEVDKTSGEALVTFYASGPLAAQVVLSGLRALGLDPAHPIFSDFQSASGEQMTCEEFWR